MCLRGLAALFFVAASAAAAKDASAQVIEGREGWRPPALEPTEKCEVWHGTGTGNDPTKLVEVLLCNRDQGMIGAYQSSSKLSGWSVRTMAGAWNAAHTTLKLRELKMTVDKPENGWHFCKVDEYRFFADADPESLTGEYDSKDCHDYGKLTLHLFKRYRGPPPDERRQRPPGEGAIVPPPTAPPARARISLCAAGPIGREMPWGIVGLTALVVTAWRRRR